MQDNVLNIVIALAIMVCALIAALLWKSDSTRRREQRIVRVTNRKKTVSQKGMDAMSLRRKSQDKVPILGKIISKLPTQSAIKARLERAGLDMPADKYVILSLSVLVFITFLVIATGKPVLVGILAGVIAGGFVPYMIIGYMGGRRIKKFIIQFPDAIDFIVRGLRSGLPVTESMNIVGKEMQEPVGNIFAHIGESVRLGVTLDKALQDMARKLDSTEFNFFVTSIVLQRETGGNLSEILGNLSDVLRKRMMMRLKIKAMSSEARASAMIIAVLPFVVILALKVMSPTYLDPLFDTTKGNFITAGCMFSMALGIGIMIKMTKFEI